MKHVAAVILMLLCFPLFAETIDGDTMQEIMQLSDQSKVPREIANAVMYEESRYKPYAMSHTTKEGYFSCGLFQLYLKPENIDWLLKKFWNKPVYEFDIFDPIDNATVALKYLNWLYAWKGNWYEALIFYNCGKSEENASKSAKEYARKITGKM